MKIFYSWQTDAPRKINKDFIYGALDQAVSALGDDLEVSEAVRGRIEVDQDTQGVLGSPDIVSVILRKISESDLIVADVSLVGAGLGDKRHINSNVAIELGYTFGKLGDEAVLKVMNTFYGEPDKLPFDLRTRRHPVQFCLSPQADRKTIASEQDKFVGKLVSILKQYLVRSHKSAPVKFDEVRSDRLRGAFWHDGDVIVPKNDPYVADDIYCAANHLMYFRCIPQAVLPSLSSRDTYTYVNQLPPLMSAGGYSQSRNKWGAASHCIAGDGELMGFTQLFKSREIWSVDLYYANVETKAEEEGFNPKRFIPTGAVNREYPHVINRIRSEAQKLGYGETYTIEIGASGASGLHLARKDSFWNRLPGPIFDDEVFVRQSISRDLPTGEIMNEFWTRLFSEAGHEVPPDLVWRAA